MTSTGHSSHSVRCGSVLVVDDNDSVRRMLHVALQSAGFEVVEAGTQLELQRRLSDARPDALLIDLQRAETDGLDLLRRMRARQSLCDVPIVFLSSNADHNFRWRTLRAGADWFSVRPVGVRDLRTKLADLIRNGRPLRLSA